MNPGQQCGGDQPLAAKGHVWWPLAGVMAVTNVAGSLLGTRLALQHGAGFVRGVFVLVVTALIVKTAWSAYGGWYDQQPKENPMSVDPQLRTLDIEIPTQPEVLVKLSLLMAAEDIDLQAISAWSSRTWPWPPP